MNATCVKDSPRGDGPILSPAERFPSSEHLVPHRRGHATGKARWPTLWTAPAMSRDRHATRGGAAGHARGSRRWGANRSGFYVGGPCRLHIRQRQTPRWAIRRPLHRPAAITPYGSFIGGVQAGYEHYFPSKLMLGIEPRRVIAPTISDLAPTLFVSRHRDRHGHRRNSNGLMSLRGRVGYDMGGWTPFVHRRHRLGEHALFRALDLTTGNEGRQPEQHPAGLRGWAAGRSTIGLDFTLVGARPSISTPISD